MAFGVLFSEFQRLCRGHGWALTATSEPQIQAPGLTTYGVVLELGATNVHLDVAEVDAAKVAVTDALSILRNFNCDFLLTRKISSRSSGLLRGLGVNHGDLSGRLIIRAGTVVIELDGHARVGHPISTPTTGPPRRRAGESRTPATVDILSPKSAQLVFSLLAWPDLLKAPMRRIAETAGVSVGLVPRTLGHLIDGGILGTRTQWTKQGRVQMARAWLSAYPSRLCPSLEIDFLEGPPPADLHLHDAVISAGSAIPDLMTASISTLYVADIRPELIRANRLRRGPQPNVRIRRRFWDDRQLLAPEGSTKLAPPLLIYADLLTSVDAREQEVANVYLQKEPGLQWLRSGVV